MTFSVNLKRLRELSNLTQEELATKAGTSKSAISMYERGERFPSEQMLETFADLFNVDMNMLLGKQEKSTYYLDPETAALAQELKDNPEYRALLDASKGLKPESVKEIMAFIKYQKAKEEGHID
jgi:transcriptional regulator with XRE-family HTH domain